jgi:serine/threonine-protein kinase
MKAHDVAPALPDRVVREQVERIVSSAAFQRSDRLKHFLTFVVTEALQGRADALKEYTIGVQVFGRESTFDPRMDPVVRVQARRLRARLERYYREEGQHDEIAVELPKGGYAPAFSRRGRFAAPAVPRPRSPVHRNTIAVRISAPETRARDLGSLCRVLTDAVIHRLVPLNTVNVVAADATQAGTAALRLEGRLRQSGRQLRLDVQLIDARTGYYLWAESLDPGSPDSSGVEVDLAEAIVERIRPHLPGTREGRRGQTENLTARNLCKQGLYHLEQRTDESLERAAELFERAVVEDAQYSLAHSGLSDAYSLLSAYSVRLPTSLTMLAMSSAATAVMLDDESVQARTSLAHSKVRAQWNWVAAELDFQQAIRLDPAYATAHHWYARCCLLPLGRLDEALEECTHAQRLDPVSSIVARELGVIHYFRRDFETALAQCDQTIELNPYFSYAYYTLSLVQEQLGDAEEAMAALQRALQLAPRSPRMIAGLGRAHAMAGRTEEALASLRELDELAAVRYLSPFERALVHLGLKQIDRCIEQLQLAYEHRCFEVNLLAIDPRFDPLRSDRRFAALLQEVGVSVPRS